MFPRRLHHGKSSPIPRPVLLPSFTPEDTHYQAIPRSLLPRPPPPSDHRRRNPAGYSNGNTFDFEGRQISFEHVNRRVVRYEHNGAVTVLADKFEGKKFNAPNDGAVHPDGSVWFTDPGYGSLLNYEGYKNDL